jgi:hypothetical protein
VPTTLPQSWWSCRCGPVPLIVDMLKEKEKKKEKEKVGKGKGKYGLDQ